MAAESDLVFPAKDRETLAEIAGWDALRLPSFAASDFPLDVVRFSGSASPPVVVSRARRAETLKALPATLRDRARAAFERAERAPARWGLAGGRALELGQAPLVMGVVNVTPDSFSDGGLAFDRDRAIERALRLFEEGAHVVDVGGESTRPSTTAYGSASEVSLDEELSRVVPVVRGIRRASAAPLSVDTRKAAVARAALAEGADAVNDVSALRHDPEMAGVVAAAGAGLVLMHMRGDDPRRMQDDTAYAHPVADIAEALAAAAAAARAAGTAPGKIAVDPGLGFGKSPEGNLALLRHLAAFRTLGFPVAVGASRKGFVRRFSGIAEDSSAADRLPGSLAAVAAAAAAGAALVRVHDVADTVRFLRMSLALSRPAPVAASARAREEVR
ncbi:MAG TPA: dihydropteroate synthase [Thermoanaerobaculia bacterium]|nr:dihydropteroate synthase [Thermoanaerobaculia bacterium]